MGNRNFSAEEAAVNKHLQEGAARMAQLQAQIDNLPTDRGLNPELKPAGGPANMSNAHINAELQKQIGETRKHMLKQIEQELKNAPPDVRDRSNQVVDKALYPQLPGQDERKTMDQSAAYMYQLRYEKEPSEQQPGAKDIKTLDQSQDYAYRLRFGDEPNEPGEGVEDVEMDMDIDRD